ncbi:glycosyl transferase [Candidatus Scalindua japonica]|uniref:Glycosyl transferase n=2 Tax=Candidatus Scalindua japonica TaxID=1284222 RepID=A0A286TTK7_9BACT|nr:glycosyl transferase [Candidatus Scalindua japonica]
MKDLTISIVNYNSKEHILKCIESIYAHGEGIDIDVYVVDNNSTDGSVDDIKKNYPDVKLIMNNENRGFGDANNQVLKRFNSRYCLITNPDIIILSGTLQELVKFMDANKDAGAVGCKVLNPDRSLQYSCRRYPSFIMSISRGLLIDSIFPNNKIIKKYLMMDSEHDKVMPVEWLTGCCLMVRHETIKEVGTFDKNFFMYFEDVDICRRINKNWKVYYLPDVQMIHGYQSNSRRIGNLKHKLIHLKSAIYFFKKHGLFTNNTDVLQEN